MLNVSVVGSRSEDLVAAFRERGIRVSSVDFEQFERAHPAGSAGPDAFVVDIRQMAGLPRDIGQMRRLFPASGIIIVALTVESADLLEAMRIGVNEWLTEPLNFTELASTLHRVARPVARPQIGRTIAIVGAKGGVGTTTIAVNLATSVRRASKQPTLLVDLHLFHGDAAVLLGVDPRFSVVDALANIDRMDEAYLKGLVASTKAGVDLLASSTTQLSGSVDSSRVRSLLEFLATTYPFIVLDCPRSDARLLEAIDGVSQTVVVANQELTTLRTASRIVNSLQQRCGSERITVALSRLDQRAEIVQSDVEFALGAPVKYVFPNDYRTASQAITRGEPLILQNHTKLASVLEDVAHDLAGLPRKPKESGKTGLRGLLSVGR